MDEAGIVNEFLRLYALDRKNGASQALHVYQRRFPEHEELIAREYARLRERETELQNPLDEPLDHGERIGPYRILATLGQGGMGIVYLAEQKEPVHRRVALKVIRLGIDTKEVLGRFELERRALAAMSHSCIAKVFDAGSTDRGQPYFVMELVQGLPLTEYCDRHRLSLKERIALFQQVCAGVQHAHQKGVIHRDLKPGNILVVRESDQAVPKILDFGLAKATNQELVQQTIYTERERMLGTPEYMAPEQAALEGEAIDTRADIYSLGVILYELLTGELPFSSDELRKAGWVGMRRILTEVEPQKPSTRISTLGARGTAFAEKRGTTQPTLGKALRGDLDWIVLKAMSKEPERRYDSATGLAMDLKRYLEHEPVLAGPPSAGYRLRKLLRRYRLQVVAGSLVFLAFVAGGIGTFVQYLRAEHEAEEKGRLAIAEAAAKEDAEAKATELRQKTTEFDQLSGVVLHERAVESERELYPAWPALVPAMQRWLAEQAEPLLAERGRIEETVAALRKRALDSGAEPAPPPGAESSTEHADAGSRHRFAEESQAFLHETLTELLRKLDDFERDQVASVRKRLAWAKGIEALSLANPNARITWETVRKAVATSEKYTGRKIELRDRDVLGLVPIGMNPATGYFEFYHLRSAWNGSADPREIPIPEHREDGSIEVTGETGIVFVLLPGGVVTLSSQSEDEDAPNYDPQRQPHEALHDVTLAPFFLARHELTQGQWARLWDGGADDRQPSYYKAGNTIGGVRTITLADPVEQVDWSMCDRMLGHYGLLLPTEAQWEYGCRGGTTSPWICGLAELKDYANVADATAKRAVASWSCEEWEDGHIVHARVGSFLPNGFGLYDVHGNVWEWCRDWFGDYGTERPGDGLRPKPPRAAARVSRGGGFSDPAIAARSAMRNSYAPTFRNGYLGLRAARPARLPD